METGRMSAPAGVAEEIAFLDTVKDELRREHPGRFVVIHGKALVGAFETEDEAFREGVRMIGTLPFLIARLGAEDEQMLVPVLVELGAQGPVPEDRFIPSHSWRRGKLVDDPIVEMDIPPPRVEDGS